MSNSTASQSLFQVNNLSRARRNVLRTIAVGGAAGPVARLSSAQTAWPNKPIQIVVPFGAGGSLDLTTRLVAQRLSERLGVAVNVENVTGAGGSVGIQKTIRSTADGYTLLMAGDAPLNPTPTPGGSFYRHDMRTELTPISLINTAPMVLIAHPSVKANNFDEFLVLLRANPGRLNYATSGIGTILHLTMEMIKQQAKVFITHIPYRGGAQIVNDVIGNQIETALLINATVLPAIKTGSIKALAVTSQARLPWLPQVPAIAESKGFAGFSVSAWAGLYAPAKTPESIVSRINTEVEAILKTEAVKTRLSEFGAVVQGGTPEVFSRFIEQDRARFASVLKSIPLG